MLVVPNKKSRVRKSGWRSLAALLGTGLLLLGCETQDTRAEAAAWSAGDESTSFPVTIARPAGSGYLSTPVLEFDSAPSRVGCATCHEKGSVAAIAELGPDNPPVVHASLTLEHGELACVSCHEAGSPARLHSSDGQSFPLSEAMQLCSQCHGLIRRAYDHGAHGGMRGYWDLQRGPRTRNDCTTCHDPHSPAHKAITPVAGPKDRFGDSAPRHPGSAIEQRFHEGAHE